jgi:hypothetical protein
VLCEELDMTPAGSEPGDVGQDGRAALTVAHALEQLVAVIDRELNAEASEGVALADPAWADAIATVVDAAESSCAVLDQPDVLSVLTRASVSS